MKKEAIFALCNTTSLRNHELTDVLLKKQFLRIVILELDTCNDVELTLQMLEALKNIFLVGHNLAFNF